MGGYVSAGRGGASYDTDERTGVSSGAGRANGAAAGANPYLLSIILPAVKFKSANANVASPDVIPQTINFQAYDDGGGSNPVIQVKLVNKEASAL